MEYYVSGYCNNDRFKPTGEYRKAKKGEYIFHYQNAIETVRDTSCPYIILKKVDIFLTPSEMLVEVINGTMLKHKEYGTMQGYYNTAVDVREYLICRNFCGDDDDVWEEPYKKEVS